MRYFSGFSLQGEESLFQEYIVGSEFTLVGFSYGAIQAFEYALTSSERIDRLILLSPALFQTQKRSFIKTQLKYFKLDRENYIENFLKSVAYPSNIDLHPYLKIGTLEELEFLLNYRWSSEKLSKIRDRGVDIEVFIGEKDKIIDAKGAFELFSKVTTTYFLKGMGHILKR
jgi:pimeloyl-ACP methyl ester carboxylesterase